LKSLSDATGKLIGSVKSGIEIAVEAGKNSLMSHGGASDIILVSFSRPKCILHRGHACDARPLDRVNSIAGVLMTRRLLTASRR
jgi:hypothetical protein